MSTQCPNKKLDVSIEASILKEVVKAPTELMNDAKAKFRWTPDGMKLRVKDGAKVMQIEQMVTPVAFEEFSLATESQIETGLDCERLEDLLESADEDTVVELSLDTLTSKMEIRFEEVAYSLPMTDVDSIRDPDPIDLQFQNIARIHSSVFKRTAEVVSMVGDPVHFEMGDGKTKIYGNKDGEEAEISPDTTSEGSNNAFADEGAKVILEQDNGLCSSKFGLKYMEKLPKFLPDDFSGVKLSDNFPLLVKTNRCNQRIPTKIVIAPRLSDT